MTQQRTGTTQHLVYSSLRSSILSLNLVPGTVISENDISLRFKVSRTPVREAFITLSKEALLKVIPQKGSVVSHIDFNRVNQELFLRANLESAALKQFVQNYNPSRLAELDKYLELQSELVGTKKFEKFLQYDDQFHHVFFEGQNVAWEAMENMCGHYHRIRLLTIWLQDIVKDLVKEHKQLYQAVKKRDSAKALELLESHVHKLNTEEAMLIKLFPDFFADTTEVSHVMDFGGLKI